MQFEVGSIVEGVVTGITKFGAFVELAPGQTGLVHISEVASSYVNDVADYLKVGQTVSVKVLARTDQGKMNLSIKQTAPVSTVSARPAGGASASRKPSGAGGGGGSSRLYSKPVSPQGGSPKPRTPYHANPSAPGSDSFESMLNKFIKHSDEKNSQLKKSKDIGRRSGAKRSK